jgi:hypothetical protein
LSKYLRCRPGPGECVYETIAIAVSRAGNLGEDFSQHAQNNPFGNAVSLARAPRVDPRRSADGLADYADANPPYDTARCKFDWMMGFLRQNRRRFSRRARTNEFAQLSTKKRFQSKSAIKYVPLNAECRGRLSPCCGSLKSRFDLGTGPSAGEAREIALVSLRLRHRSGSAAL